MFCPQCGAETREPIKFCKRCGTNLRRVQGVLSKGGATDWDRAIVEDWQKERDTERKKTPEEKRLNEIKAGVIVSCAGLGSMLFFSLLFGAIANTVSGPAADILRSLWAVGLIPFLVGAGIIFNGLFISKRIVELKRRQEQSDQPMPLFTVPNTSPVARLAESSPPSISDYSITEPTTTKLREPVPVSPPRDTN